MDINQFTFYTKSLMEVPIGTLFFLHKSIKFPPSCSRLWHPLSQSHKHRPYRHLPDHAHPQKLHQTHSHSSNAPPYQPPQQQQAYHLAKFTQTSPSQKVWGPPKQTSQCMQHHQPHYSCHIYPIFSKSHPRRPETSSTSLVRAQQNQPDGGD